MLDWQSQVLSGGNLEVACDTWVAGLQDTSSSPAFIWGRFLLSTLPTLPSTLPNTYLKTGYVWDPAIRKMWRIDQLQNTLIFKGSLFLCISITTTLVQLSTLSCLNFIISLIYPQNTLSILLSSVSREVKKSPSDGVSSPIPPTFPSYCWLSSLIPQAIH